MQRPTQIAANSAASACVYPFYWAAHIFKRLIATCQNGLLATCQNGFKVISRVGLICSCFDQKQHRYLYIVLCCALVIQLKPLIFLILTCITLISSVRCQRSALHAICITAPRYSTKVQAKLFSFLILITDPNITKKGHSLTHYDQDSYLNYWQTCIVFHVR